MSEFFPYRFDGRFVPMWLSAGALPWRDGVTVTDDGRFIAYTVNEAGISRLKLLDTRTRKTRAVTGLPVGTMGGLDVAPWGDIAVTVSSARSPADVYVVNRRRADRSRCIPFSPRPAELRPQGRSSRLVC